MNARWITALLGPRLFEPLGSRSEAIESVRPELGEGCTQVVRRLGSIAPLVNSLGQVHPRDGELRLRGAILQRAHGPAEPCLPLSALPARS